MSHTRRATFTIALSLTVGVSLALAPATMADVAASPAITTSGLTGTTVVPTKLIGVPQSITEVAGRRLTVNVTVTPKVGRTAILQQWDTAARTWASRAKQRVNSTTGSGTLIFPKSWYASKKTVWRVSIPAASTTDAPAGTTMLASAATSSSIAVTSRRVYDTPQRYRQLSDKVALKGSGAYDLKRGTMGLKVRKVQKRLGMGSRWAKVDSATMSRVAAFQRKKGLRATGVVNLKTWRSMGFSKKSWTTLGAYASPVQVGRDATRKDRIEAMISRAKEYLGDPFVVGASGRPGQGVDCSGLVMQGLYAAGMNAAPVSPIRHSHPGYEYESRNIGKDKKLKRVPIKSLKRGDLVLYTGPSGYINHIGIYLGHGKVIESWPNKVQIAGLRSHRSSRPAYGLRPFA